MTGDAVNLAKRIEQAAAPGEILIGETTSRIVRHAACSTPREPPLRQGEAGRRHGAPASNEVDLTSEALPRRLDAPMVGRGGGARDAASRVHARRRDAEAAARHRARPARDRQVATCARAARTESRARRASSSGAASRTARESRSGPCGRSSRARPSSGTREEIFWRIRKQLEALAAERPLVVCFEDVHWGEPTFLDLVQYLKGWIPEGPVLLLCLARPELLDKRPDWPRNEPEATALTLDPLNDARSRATSGASWTPRTPREAGSRRQPRGTRSSWSRWRR